MAPTGPADPKFYVIFPDKGTQAFSWYALFGTSGIARTDLEPSQIAAMVRDVSAKYAIDPTNVRQRPLGRRLHDDGHARDVPRVKDGQTMLATIVMKAIGHGTPVDPGSGPDQGGWDPVPSKTASSDTNTPQDWSNTAGIWGPYYSAKFFGLVP